MNYSTCHYPGVSSYGYTPRQEGAQTSFFPIAPFAVGLGLGLLPFAAAGLAYGGCRGPYCGGGCAGPYCGGGGFYGGYGPGWRGGYW